jgi:hypothetical protein
MNTRKLHAAVAALIAVAATGAAAQLSITSNGPYYATPSWDQKLTTGRFVILANWNSEAVLDRETGLVWQKAPNDTPITLDTAAFWCHIASTGGRRGWRLPRAEELSSLLLPDATGMATLPAGHPFDNIHTVSQGFYWSTTRSLALNQTSTQMWVVSFYNGAGGAFSSGSNYFWCVRGGQGADAQ